MFSLMEQYSGTEADAISDGADFANNEFDYEELDKDIAWAMVTEQIRNERKARVYELRGKYIVVTDSRYEAGVQLYLQDQELGSGYWTKFISNARGFVDENQAIVKAKNLKYGNPKVLKVMSDGSYRRIL